MTTKLFLVALLVSLLGLVPGCGAGGDGARDLPEALPDAPAVPDAPDVPEPSDLRERTPEPENAPEPGPEPAGFEPVAEGPQVPDVVETIEIDVAADTPDAPDATDASDADVPAPPPVSVPSTSLADGFHVPLVPPTEGAPFSLIMASDPQLWWNFVDGQAGQSDAVVEAQNQLHVDAMNALIAGTGLPSGCPPPLAVAMNGDLTEYGRWAQWDAYYRLYQGVHAPIFEGLGNHDYENNNEFVSDGCGMDVAEWQPWRKACDQGSTQTLWGQSACQVADSIKELWHWCASDTMRRMRYWLTTHATALYDHDPGSAAYSWELGAFHFVQLHNRPDYQVPQTRICSAMPWLKKDLHDAFLRDRKIVLLLHRPVDASLAAALEGYQYHVVGIFYGHIHSYVGYDGDLAVGGVAIPKFYCGSAEWNVFSLAEFEADHLTVTVIDSNTGAPVHHPTADAYDNLGGARAAAPFTYAYPVNPCPAGQAPTGPDGAGACLEPAQDATPVELCY